MPRSPTRLKEYAGEIAEGFRYLKGEKAFTAYTAICPSPTALPPEARIVLAISKLPGWYGAAALLISAETLGRMLGAWSIIFENSREEALPGGRHGLCDL